MSLEGAIHRLWESSALLTAEVPINRVFTGQAAAQSAWPYVTLERHGLTRGEQTSSNTRIESVPIRFNIWDQRLDRAQQVASFITEVFNRRALECAEARVLDFRLAGKTEQQQPDGVWRLGVDFVARVAHVESPLS
jgi:hypothetical protein